MKQVRRGCLPDLMTRFREEHYATRAHKAFTRRKTRAESFIENDWRTGRALYFQKSLQERQAIRKAQKAKVNNA